MPVISKPITLAPLLPCNSINTPPNSPSQTYLHYRQLIQHLIVKILTAILKIIQVALPFLPSLLSLFPLINLKIKEILEVRGFKVRIKVLNEIYTREIPKTHLKIH